MERKCFPLPWHLLAPVRAVHMAMCESTNILMGGALQGAFYCTKFGLIGAN